MKYNDPLSKDKNDANNKAISQIAPGSIVLEFGSANGRMTHYLKEQMGCQVYIVELEQEAFNDAIQYAVDGICCDIMDNRWLEKFSDIRFDYITFLDVLEHLYKPEQALKDCKSLLKDEGSVIISVPNIANNAVLLNLFENRFSYTETGLLDNTHIRFFARENLPDFCKYSGFCIVREDVVLGDYDQKEQYRLMKKIHPQLLRLLEQRPNGSVYQFVLTLQKCECVSKEIPSEWDAEERSNLVTCKVYYDIGAGFNEGDCICQSIENPANFEYTFLFPAPVKAFRFDPVENCGCIVKNIEVFSDIGFLKAEPVNGCSEAGLFLFDNTDPQIQIVIPEGKNPTWITVKMSAYAFQDMEIYKICQLLKKNVQMVFNTLEEKKISEEQLTEYYQDVINQKDQLQKTLFEEKDEQTQAFLALKDAEAQRLLSEKDQALSEKDQALSEKDQALSEKDQALSEKDQALSEKDQAQQQGEALSAELVQAQQRGEALSAELVQAHGQGAALSAELAQAQQQGEALSAELAQIHEQLTDLMQQHQSVLNSFFWKSTTPFRWTLDRIKGGLRFGKNFTRECLKLGKKVVRNLRSYGIKTTFNKIRIKGKECLSNATKSGEVSRQIESCDAFEIISQWIDSTPHDFIDIFHVPMGWNTPLFQRFQHLSLQAGALGGIAIYGAHPLVDKEIDIYEMVTPTLCIVNFDNYDIRQRLFYLLDQKPGLKYIRLQSIDLATTIDELKSFRSRGYEVVYEYIDEITPEIVGNIPKFVFERHEFVLRNEEYIAIATADKLYDQMMVYRNANMAMINNGVDYDHWHVSRESVACPADIADIVSQGKIIIGYHGALAQWLDYPMLCRIAKDDRFIILLIGHAHDEHLQKSGLLSYSNVHFIGARPYAQLNQYAAFYDVAILPFILSDLTLSVSPVKIFEYMALEKPVVTYALPECKKYQSCLCADNADEFIHQVEVALTLINDGRYQELLRKEALENTWQSIMQKTLDLVWQNYNQHQKEPDGENVATVPSICLSENSSALGRAYAQQVLAIPDKSKEFVALAEDTYQRKKNDSKIIAYYLTQFHPDPHNEEWWGRGVTEWNNVCRAVPQYVGHYQPRLPGELGFYDLRIRENMARQIELAQMYGVYGFSFYYYWFNGERLLEQPLEQFLNDSTLQIPFCLCWANENWTKRYDGTSFDILMEQPKTVKSYKAVITDMVRFLVDPRYITVDGKKAITVYRPDLMPKAQEVLQYWRDYAQENGAGELYLIAVKVNCVELDLLEMGYDAITEFHPGTVYTNCKNITKDLNYLRDDFGGEVFDYQDIVENKKYLNYTYPKLYRAVMPMWDNTARRNHKGMIFQGATPALYKRWLKDAIEDERKRGEVDENMVFINAWNEWGEGAYLEPDKRYGYAYLQATREAVEETRIQEELK